MAGSIMTTQSNIIPFPELTERLSAERMKAARRKAWFQNRWWVVEIDQPGIPAMVRQWIIQQAKAEFGG